MANARWERVAAATGVLFVALLVIPIFLPGESPPQIDDSIGDIRAYYSDNANALQAGAYLQGLAGFFFLWFLGSLRSALVRAEGEPGRLAAVAFGSGLVVVAVALVGIAISVVLATRVADLAEDAVVRALFDSSNISLAFVSFPIAALVAATSVVAIRTGVLSTWLGWAGELLVLAWLVAGIGTFVESGAFSATGAFGFIVFLVWLAWVLVISLFLVQRAGAPRAAPMPGQAP